MNGVTLKISDETRRFRDDRPATYGMENSLARKYRRTHPHKTAEAAAADLDLTPGEGRGIALGTASKTTLNKAFKTGGWPLVIEVFSDLLGESLDQFLEQEQRRMAHEERRSAEHRAHLKRMGVHLSSVLDLRADGGS